MGGNQLRGVGAHSNTEASPCRVWRRLRSGKRACVCDNYTPNASAGVLQLSRPVGGRLAFEQSAGSETAPASCHLYSCHRRERRRCCCCFGGARCFQQRPLVSSPKSLKQNGGQRRRARAASGHFNQRRPPEWRRRPNWNRPPFVLGPSGCASERSRSRRGERRRDLAVPVTGAPACPKLDPIEPAAADARPA